MSAKEYGVVILLENLGTRKRIYDDIENFIADWDSVLIKLEENISVLEDELSGRYRTGIRMKDIFDNIQIFYPTDNPVTEYVDLTGSNALWWSLQHSAELLINLVRFALTKRIYLIGGISIGYIREYRNGYFSKSMIENADLLNNFPMIGVKAGLSALWVLNNKSYQSPSMFYHFVKYRIRTEHPDLGLNIKSDELVLLNMRQRSTIFTNVSDKEIDDVIQREINNNSGNILEKWQNTSKFINDISTLDDENLFL